MLLRPTAGSRESVTVTTQRRTGSFAPAGTDRSSVPSVPVTPPQVNPQQRQVRPILSQTPTEREREEGVAISSPAGFLSARGCRCPFPLLSIGPARRRLRRLQWTASPRARGACAACLPHVPEIRSETRSLPSHVSHRPGAAGRRHRARAPHPTTHAMPPCQLPNQTQRPPAGMCPPMTRTNPGDAPSDNAANDWGWHWHRIAPGGSQQCNR